MVPEINIYIDPLIADDVYIRRDAKFFLKEEKMGYIYYTLPLR